jgi:malonyl CoA-acyl carrier protein transacylase
MSSSIWVFPGQGSQHKGMGEALFARFPDLVNEADEVLGYSIRELCLEDLNGVLGETEFTQPALFVVSALGLLAQREDGLAAPQCYAGHSLGEFAALFAAGAFDFATGVALVKERGRLMSTAPRGAMAAVVGLTQARVAELIAGSAFNGIDIANVNCAQQIVISGLYDDIVACETLFTQATMSS